MQRTSLLSAAAVFALSLAAALPAPAQTTYQVIAFGGDPVPEAGPGVIVAEVSYGRFQAAGQTTFYGVLSGPGIDDSHNFGVFVAGPAGPRLAVREGDPAPGIPGAYLGFPYYALPSPGQELIQSELTGPGVDPANREAAWLRTPTSTTLIARTGDRAPDTEDATVFRDLYGLTSDRAGHVMFEAYLQGPTVTSATAQALYAGPAAAPRLLARAGSPAPDTGGQLFGQILLPRFGAGGQIAFAANVTGDPEHHYSRLFYGDADQVHQVISPGTHAPGTAEGVEFRTLWCPQVNAAGQMLLAMDGALTGPGVDVPNDDGLWVGTPAHLQLAARSGDPAPGTGGKRFNGVYDMTLDDELPMFIDPVLGDGGHVAFSARLTDDQGNLLPEWGFWAGLPGDLRLIESHAVRHPRLNALGQLVYADDLDGDPATPGSVIAFADLEGRRQILLQEGQVFDFGAGDVRTVWTWDYDTYHDAPLSDTGGFLMNVTFTDGSQALILATIPEPAALSLLVLAPVLCGRRRRYC